MKHAEQLSKQEGVGQARAILAAELGIGPKASGEGADAAALADKAGVIPPGPASALGGVLPGAPVIALKVTHLGMGDAPAAKESTPEDSCSVGEQPLELLPLTPALGAPAPKRRRTPRVRSSSSVKQALDPEPIFTRA